MNDATEHEAIARIAGATSREQILHEIKSTMAIMFELEPDTITLEARLVDDLDLDSIDAIDLAVKMQDMIGARVDENALRKLRTIGDVVDLIEGMLRSRR
jgi:acyl carrier protein